MLNSRKMTDLHPKLQDLCKKLLANCAKRGVKVMLTNTKRDAEYQAYLYASGRTRPGGIVTNMKLPGPHAFGLAFDVVPLSDDGKNCLWNDHKKWAIIGEEGKKLGLEWGGDWKDFIDKPHFQLTDKLTGAQLRAGKRPKWY